ncbi:cytochrome b/b6 domain-containing protein [Falsiroseomonas oryzae]|uniref:cytochrome b/b6 domain-containing protein n=1 Tax=Falsiroseomonas oryzae TaxID=2766473 RepID=UPI0022EAD9C5|nr:cytochrome b/b6 domain-containing protein [Roseomonas sp. MO-31]
MTMLERGVSGGRLKVWDPWVRLTHWAIVLLLPFSWWTAETSRFDLHFLSGYAILSLVLFRIAWGIVGSDTARFARFLKGPVAAMRHLAHLRRREAPVDIGHNAAGGWMVLLLLGLLLVQAIAGLFSDDLIFTRGPLARRVDEAWSSLATSVHLRVFWVIVACAVLHILAVVAYRVLLGRNLVRPMVTGVLQAPGLDRAPPPRMGSPLLALVLLAGASTFSWWISTLAPLSAF